MGQRPAQRAEQALRRRLQEEARRLSVLLRRPELRRDHADRLGSRGAEGRPLEQGQGPCRTEEANFKSLRGDFKYNTNNFPIENFYIQETVKDPQGVMTVKTIATAVKDAKDSYYEKCPMK